MPVTNQVITNPVITLLHADSVTSFYTNENQPHLAIHPEILDAINNLPTQLESGEFYLNFQPQLELEKNKFSCIESLIRWHNKNAGIISPDLFIPLIERTEFIYTLTNWVLNQTLKQLNDWNNKGYVLNASINLSMQDLHNENFPGEVEKLLDRYSISARQLTFEVTEGVIMHDPEQVMRIMIEICKLGVKFSLDDYGTGYSSLSHLASLPISELKIDRALVIDMYKNKKHAMIVRSTIELAHILGLRIVAEGVENSETFNLLKTLNCDAIQGHYLSKPVSHNECLGFYKDYNQLS